LSIADFRLPIKAKKDRKSSILPLQLKAFTDSLILFAGDFQSNINNRKSAMGKM